MLSLAFLPQSGAQEEPQQNSEIKAGLWKDTVDGKQRELTVFQPKMDGKKYSGTVANWTARNSSQSATRVAFAIPELRFAANIAVSNLMTQNSPVATDAVRVERSAISPVKGAFNLIQDFAVIEIAGKQIRTQKLFDLEWGSLHAHIDFDEKNPRDLTVKSGQISGTFTLPEEIEGQILGFEMDPKTSRLSVQASNGVSYLFSLKIEKGKLKYIPDGRIPMPDGLRNFAATSEKFDCAATPAPTGSSGEMKNLNDSQNAQ